MPATATTPVQRVLSEDVLTLAEAQSEVAMLTRRRPDKSTLVRWCKRGIGGITLDHAKVGVQILTSRQALNRFIEARTAQS